MTIDKLDRAMALRSMGYKEDNLSPVMAAYLDECEEAVLTAIHPVYTCRVCSIGHDTAGGEDVIDLDGLVLTGKDIAEHLQGCDRAAVMAVTVGQGADRLIRRYETEDMAKAVIADAFAGAAVEQAADMAQREIQQRYKDKWLTWRFSPGYGDLPLDLQADLLRFLRARERTGIVLRGGMLSPMKSITAFIGISDAPVPSPRSSCSVCRAANSCIYRERGIHCGSS